ncbi:hypothetical protein [Acinetobacter sp.]|jgi:hypothetical protein|uniref:hypothetical protein n=1 Tax=Acinetobacter sp. TaxID=472 RepID=UPI0035B14999
MMNKMLSALIFSWHLSTCSEPNSQPQDHASASYSNTAQTDPSSANSSNPSASRNTAHNQPNPDKNISQNDRQKSAPPADAAQRKANSKVFKVLDNNPDNYGEESYQIQTTEGQLSIYTLNLSRHNAAALSEVKAGDCLKLTLQSGTFQAMQGFIAIDELQNASIQACP